MKYAFILLLLSIQCSAQIPVLGGWSTASGVGDNIYIVVASSDSKEVGNIIVHGDTVDAIKNLVNEYQDLQRRYTALNSVTEHINLLGTGSLILKDRKPGKYIKFMRDYRYYTRIENTYKKKLKEKYQYLFTE